MVPISLHGYKKSHFIQIQTFEILDECYFHYGFKKSMASSKYESHCHFDLKRGSLSKMLKEDIFSRYADSTDIRSIVFQSLVRP